MVRLCQTRLNKIHQHTHPGQLHQTIPHCNIPCRPILQHPVPTDPTPPHSVSPHPSPPSLMAVLSGPTNEHHAAQMGAHGNQHLRLCWGRLVRWDRMRWDRVRWNRMRWDRMRWNGTRWACWASLYDIDHADAHQTHNSQHRTIQHHTTPRHAAPHCTTPHSTTPHHTPPHYTTPHHNPTHPNSFHPIPPRRQFAIAECRWRRARCRGARQ